MTSVPDFEARWSAEWEKRIGPLAKRRDELQKQRAAIHKRIADTEAYEERVERQVNELETLAGKALAEGQGSYAKYQTSLRDRTRELEDKRHEVTSLEKALAATEADLTLANRRLSEGEQSFFRDMAAETQPEFVEQVIEGAVLAWVDAYVAAGRRLCARVGDGFPGGDIDLRIGLRHERLHHNYPGGVRILSEIEERALTEKKPASPKIPLTPTLML